MRQGGLPGLAGVGRNPDLGEQVAAMCDGFLRGLFRAFRRGMVAVIGHDGEPVVYRDLRRVWIEVQRDELVVLLEGESGQQGVLVADAQAKAHLGQHAVDPYVAFKEGGVGVFVAAGAVLP